MGYAVCWLLALVVAAEGRKNVLHIIIDDLRPELPPYKDSEFYPGSNADIIQAPNIAKLAKKSTLFDRAYCQYPLCTPSRASFLTGRRPLTTGILEAGKYFRDLHPKIVTIPGFFKRNGYAALGTGKVFHPVGDESSLSFDKFVKDDRSLVKAYTSIGNTWEAVSDEPHGRKLLPDEEIRDNAVQMLKNFVDGDYKKSNFYMTVGFMKPHLPWVAPQRFFDLYDTDDIILPENKKAPKNMPFVAWPHSESCILEQLDNSPTAERIEGYFNLTVPDDLAAQYHRGYYACISYIDSLVGDVLATLEDLDLHENTIIVLHSDHGYDLGENSAWGKRTQFEKANHVPLMVHLPGETEGKVSGEFAELVDLFPTVVELTGFPATAVPRCSRRKENLCHEGVSLAPIVKGKELHSPKESAYFVQYHHVKKPVKGRYLAESVLSREGRFTEWYLQHGHRQSPGRVFAEELYDHDIDKDETVNVIHDNEYAHLRWQLHQQLKSK
ncbi:hypothetical protein CAPTEDRAFT_175760 [Capitella teleta]|uniref:Sulfatase N-terminal domain-containing protein n=1 Tax=Capitella teleta TaxID=283909 RepID=R7U449_CAPTE|nr:hypothetical protein CAPTEDRAFT_175760 [Capitella teleta]|eukprot:ELU00749.1 hypothetical protein CAPTEDRAFT_175760 [Capitella teleta]